MALELVHDSAKVATIPIGNLMDIAGQLSGLGQQIDKGEHGAVLSVISVVVRDDGLAIFVNGENCSHYELMGLFEAAKLRVFADDAIED